MQVQKELKFCKSPNITCHTPYDKVPAYALHHIIDKKTLKHI